MMKQIELESIKQGINLTINDHEESAQGNGQSTQTFSVQSQAIYRGRGRRPSGAPKNHIDPQAAQKDYQQLFSNWDDDQMDIFQVNDVKNNRELLAALQPIAQKIGFQIKVTQNLSRQEFIKQMEKSNSSHHLALIQEELEFRFIKIECGYPLKSCPFYLLYKVTPERSVIFACSLNHSHSMGPIPLPPIIAP